MTPREILDKAYKALDDKLATDITVLDVAPLTIIADYFIICTANSASHANALVGELGKVMKEQNVMPHHIEGYNSPNWVLLDYPGVIIHIFDNKTREFYALERVWADAAPVTV